MRKNGRIYYRKLIISDNVSFAIRQRDTQPIAAVQGSPFLNLNLKMPSSKYKWELV